jgi:pimeloyl-ACP methyl ester carboxylesterase
VGRQLDTLRGLLSRQDPKQFLFFTRTANGKREGKAFLARLQERTIDRDTPTTISSYLAQLKACRRWSKEEPHDLSRIRQPVLLANGDHDRMLPTPNTRDMARRLPNNELVIYPPKRLPEHRPRRHAPAGRSRPRHRPAPGHPPVGCRPVA